ncbi:LAME_0F13366g1_1 [Lachancea meyersii CBS 8951]|uniref:protein-tyrosine-phosphatase n=1 Tax=Lachancea meyersii CBS 8951 TaxID=1266667 RepID=A0A1G4JXI9_9SACH|nr:LAME_0F13366g1_1 [Lachancea meyersii CBS 8951]
MVSRWPECVAEMSDTVSDTGSVVSSSSTLVGSDPLLTAKSGSFPARPHRRAISALALGRNAPNLTSAQSFHSTNAANGIPTTTSGPAMPFLNRSMSNPSLPSFKPKEMQLPRPEGTQSLSPAQLRTLIVEEPAENLIILDVRPFVDYSRSTIINALHVCLPSTLLRRKTFTLDRLIENLPREVHVIVKRRILDRTDCSKLKVIIFDNTVQSTSQDSVGVGCHGMASKFANADKWSSEQLRPSIYILSPGFPAFENLEPSLIINPSVTSSSISPGLPPSPQDMASTPQPGSSLNISNQCPSMASPSPIATSPASSSSPVSTLSKFQLPMSTGIPPPFKIPRNEEVSNLESYLSAVELGEKQRSIGGSKHSSSAHLPLTYPSPDTLYKFPIEPRSSGQHNNCNNLATLNNKLNFQKSLLHMHDVYGRDAVDLVIPRWFQDLASVSKLEMVAQFQKLDLLEKKRLHSCLSNAGQPSLDSSKQGFNSFNTHRRSQCAASWFDEYNSDEEDQNVCISSGVELGSKNRYKDIFPFEHTRVVLKKKRTAFQNPISTDIWDTYINANYLVNPFVSLQDPPAAHCVNVRYIATQAPLAATMHDFYTCILNNNVPLILTLTDEFENGVEKCYKFWAEGDYDGIQITLLEEHSIEAASELGLNAGPVILRRIQIRHGEGEVHETLQAQIKNWPDMGIMVNPRQVLEIICLKNVVITELFRKQVYSAGYLPTILVHCSAGCGRTGTLCALDTVLSNASKLDGLREEWADRKLSNESNPWSPHSTTCLGGKLFDPVIITINKFRKQRISMVQNVNQYLFIYDCLLSYFDMCLQAKKCPASSPPAFWGSTVDLGIVQSFLKSKVEEQNGVI